jgi:transmembrane sensor
MIKTKSSNVIVSITEQANQWYSRIERGLSSSEKSELVAWCNQNEAHHRALLNLENLWTDLSILNELNGLFPIDSAKKKSKTFLYTSLFFMFICFLLVSGHIFNADPKSIYNDFKAYANNEVNQRFETRIGEQNSIKLPDGSSVTLNTNTILDINFTETHRKLTLVKGEAKFDVTKDLERPFTVITGNSSFTALGTIFNVQKENEKDIELLVTEGRVLISDADTEITQLIDQISQPNVHTIEDLILGQGEKTNIRNNVHFPIQILSEEQQKQDLAWQKGILIFDGEPLKSALNEVSRYTGANFTIIDDELSKLKVSGYFKTNDVEGLLQSLYYNFDIQYKQTNLTTIHLMAEPKLVEHK